MSTENNLWTTADAMKGLCDLEDVGEPRPDDLPARAVTNPGAAGSDPASAADPDPSADMTDAVFARELAEYSRDPGAYKARNAPGVITKLLEVAERRRTEAQNAAAASAARPVAQTPTRDLIERLCAKLPAIVDDLPPATTLTRMEAMRLACVDIIRTFVPVDRREVALDQLDQRIEHLARTMPNAPALH